MVIYIVRHPETEYNRKGLTQGNDDSPLTEKGINTAEKLGKLLKNREISKIYSSDLGRCIQTSRIINKFLNVDIYPQKELRERNHGDFNGKSAKLISQNFDMSNPDLILPKGESFNQMKIRVLNFINKLEKSTSVLVVTHEGCLRATISDYKNKDFYSEQCNSKPDEIRVIRDKNIKILR
ncbi:MAG: histidine phosphatase family protein [Nanoarchaeota archaeon]|nr:histidine phosphatase family protein [Nanoarchaeota archaeon]